MPYWWLVLLISAAWLLYPIAGGINVAALVVEGKRPIGAGFSFLPELIVFPACFFIVAAAIDWIAMPWGRLLIGLLCVIMISSLVWTALRSIYVLQRTRKKT
ncbi:MAG: hypothetical protein U0930_17735 [Pirellulales bacterium]